MSNHRTFLRRWGRRVAALCGVCVILLGVGLVATTWGCASFGQAPKGTRLDRVRASPLYDVEEEKLVNTVPTKTVSVGESWPVLKETLFGDQVRTPEHDIPVREDTVSQLQTPSVSGLRVTWFGHSTLLIEIDGVTILTDPIWGKRASPSRIVGPKRFHDPPLTLQELPKDLDAVIISHDHYDHLDYPTIVELKERGVPFFVPTRCRSTPGRSGASTTLRSTRCNGGRSMSSARCVWSRRQHATSLDASPGRPIRPYGPHGP